MQLQLVVSFLVLMANTASFAAEESPKATSNDRRAIVIPMSPSGVSEPANSQVRRHQILSLERTLRSRVDCEIELPSHRNLETAIHRWINDGLQASLVVVCIRSELAIEGETGLIAQGTIDGEPARLDIAALVRAFQHQSTKSSILLVLENYAAATQKQFAERLEKLLNQPESPDISLAALVFPHDATNSGASSPLCDVFVDALEEERTNWVQTDRGEILASVRKLHELVASACQQPADVQLILNQGATKRGASIPVTPRRLNEAAEFLAREMSRQIRRAGIEWVGVVPPSLTTVKKSTAPGREFGCLLPAFQNQLLSHLKSGRFGGGDSYDVVSEADMYSILNSCGLKKEQFFQVPKIMFAQIENELINQHPNSATALLSVSLERDGTAGLRFRCGLYSQSPHNVETVVESVPLTPADLPVVVESGSIPSPAAQGTSNLHTPEGRQKNQAIVESVLAPVVPEGQKPTPHNLSLDQVNCPCRISLIVNGEPQPPQFDDAKTIAFNRLKTGDRVAIRVENWLPTRVFMRLLVDGKNTLPDRVGNKGKPVPAKYVHIDSARAWLLEPAVSSDKPRINQISGFYRHLAADDSQRPKNAQGTSRDFEPSTATYNEFVVGDPVERQRNPESGIDESGQISVAFYHPVPADRTGGTETYLPLIGGPEKTGIIDIYKGDFTPAATSFLFYSLRYGN